MFLAVAAGGEEKSMPEIKILCDNLSVQKGVVPAHGTIQLSLRDGGAAADVFEWIIESKEAWELPTEKQVVDVDSARLPVGFSGFDKPARDRLLEDFFARLSSEPGGLSTQQDSVEVAVGHSEERGFGEHKIHHIFSDPHISKDELDQFSVDILKQRRADRVGGIAQIPIL